MPHSLTLVAVMSAALLGLFLIADPVSAEVGVSDAERSTVSASSLNVSQPPPAASESPPATVEDLGGITDTIPTPPASGNGEFAFAPTFGTGNVGSTVFNSGTIEELSAAVTATGGAAVWVQGTDGNWYRYNTLATGATAFVNIAFIAQFSGGLGTTAVFVVK